MSRPGLTDGENTARLLAAVAVLVLALAVAVLAVVGVPLHSWMPWFYVVLACLFIVPITINHRVARRRKG
jgi:protein-S-isoprenylcysteine O-methyltransferase Ste14